MLGSTVDCKNNSTISACAEKMCSRSAEKQPEYRHGLHGRRARQIGSTRSCWKSPRRYWTVSSNESIVCWVLRGARSCPFHQKLAADCGRRLSYEFPWSTRSPTVPGRTRKGFTRVIQGCQAQQNRRRIAKVEAAFPRNP